jgi:hypothetical protein
MFSAPGEAPFDLARDTVTEGLGRILASVYDGNPALLQRLVESEEINEYVRDAAIETFLVLEHCGQMSRLEVVDYLRSLFGGTLKRTHSHAWNGLVCAVADLPAPELLEDVRRAYADGLVDPGFAQRCNGGPVSAERTRRPGIPPLWLTLHLRHRPKPALTRFLSRHHRSLLLPQPRWLRLLPLSESRRLAAMTRARAAAARERQEIQEMLWKGLT